jgi:cytochrome P450
MGSHRAIVLPIFGDGISTQEGSKWKHSRNMLGSQLQQEHYKSLEVFREAVDHLIQLVRDANGPIDLEPLFYRLTLGTTTAFLFGESIQSLITPEAVGERDFATAFCTAQKWVIKRFRLLDLYWLVDGREFRQACRDVHGFVDQIIDRNLSGDSGKYIYLDTVAKNTPDRAAL